MNDDDNGLQDPEQWDLEHPEPMGPVARAHAAISVAFTTEELRRIGDCAKHAGMGVVEYVRAIALRESGEPGVPAAKQER